MSAALFFARAARFITAGAVDRAIPFLRASLALDPVSADALFCLADEIALRRVLRLDPTEAAALSNLGVLLANNSRGATLCFRTALALCPGMAEVWNNFGNLLQRQGQVTEASVALERAVTLAPGRTEAWNSLGNARMQQGDMVVAEGCYRQALEISPRHVKALSHLAGLLEQTGRTSEALAAYETALDVDPLNCLALSGAAHMRRQLCDWRRHSQDEEALKEAVRSGDGHISPFVFLTVGSTMEEQRLCARQWALRQCHGIEPLPPREPGSGRIRLGYLSADFYEHATAYLTAELFELHDRRQFEVFAYSWAEDDGSPMRGRLESAFDHFTDIRRMSHEEAARLIREDGIDVLLDVKGYTRYARTEILAYRPAPVQVNFLAYPGTMGAPFIDAIIADPFVLPPDLHHVFDERVVILPDCYQPNDRQRAICELAVTRAEVGLPDSGPVFASFNNSYKLTPQMFDIWMRLLRATPDSVLWLLAAGQEMEDNLRREASSRSVAPERLVFAGKMPLATHLARHRLADLFLDTLPYNAHTTASDALWAGLPVLTCVGATFAGRVAASLLRATGLPELITNSLAEYEAKALELTRAPETLRELRQRLQDNRLRAVLFDSERYTRNLEAALRQLHVKSA
ncbi:MAG TPA: tetratricopeptide repeat protein [Rhodospirillaceae bacterium]|nr:tetratricopeptide repeat protein [Rhodospirillaceae bacterium]